MENSEFKFNYYLSKYREYPLPNRNEFRKNFKKKYGNYSRLEELIVNIENYQLKKYGCTLNSHWLTNQPLSEYKRVQDNERNRRSYRKRNGKIL